MSIVKILCGYWLSTSTINSMMSGYEHAHDIVQYRRKLNQYDWYEGYNTKKFALDIADVTVVSLLGFCSGPIQFPLWIYDKYVNNKK